MTKRLKAKYHILKRFKHKFKNLWNDNKAKSLRSLRYFKKGKKDSFYGRLIDTKQVFKRFYLNVSENCFKNALFNSVRCLSRTKDKLIKNFEIRLDCVLYRSNLFPSIHKARQFISHGFIFVNNKKVTFCNAKLNNSDLVIISRKLNIFTNLCQKECLETFLTNRVRGINLEIDYRFLRLIFVFDLVSEKVHKPIKIQTNLITRFYR